MIIIYGPTGVGKTDFVYTLADHLPIEIINMDIGSFYTPLTIGTAKPDLSNVSIPHHLFNILSTPVHFTVAQYRQTAFEIVSACKKRGTIPVFVGGSGFYAKALLYAMSFRTRNKDEMNPELITWEQLYKCDPERASLIHPHDTYRIKRALQICYSGQKASDFAPRFDPVELPIIAVGLLRDRVQLHQRIDDRVHQMLDSGWIDEVASLRGTDWEQFIREKKMIGYDDILNYLNHQMQYQDLTAALSQKTKQYAKRQITLWNGLQRNLLNLQNNFVAVDSINLTFADLNLYIKQLLLLLNRTYEQYRESKSIT